MHSTRFLVTNRIKFREYINNKLDDDNAELDIRIWYLLQFKLTPYDQRYTQTPFEWMELMYRRYLTNPGYELKRDYIIKKMAEETRDKTFDEDLLSHLEDSYHSDEEKKQILKAFKEQR